MLNWIALTGWCYILVRIVIYSITTTSSSSATTTDDATHSSLLDATLLPVRVLEGICWMEVVRIALGDLPGNIVLGVVLHWMRTIALTTVLPNPAAAPATTAVLLSWALTEVTRYPMYVLPGHPLARALRLVAPLFTFPVGCGAEFYGAYLVWTTSNSKDLSLLAQAALGVLLFVNGILGPTRAYPALLKKGWPVLVGKAGGSKSTKSIKGGPVKKFV